MTAETATPPIDLPQVHPYNEPNRRWIEAVHPPDWKNPTPQGRYNLLVIGAGPAGLVAAAGAAGLGAKVALVEKHLMGGDCTNVGCVPSKALIRSGRAAAEVRHAGEFGVQVSQDQVRVDFAAVMNRMRELRAGIAQHDSARRFADLGIDVFIGEGQFAGEDAFNIDGQTIKFAKACIATGARASAPPIDGLDEIDYLTNESVFSLTELPRRLAVIGAGPIGSEMAQAFARLGSEVFLIEAMHGILPRDDRDAANVVEKSMRRDGVQLRCCGKNLKLSRRDDGGVHLSVDAHEPHHETEHSEHYELDVDRLLVGVGRKPNVEGLGLDKAGVEFDEKKGIEVNDYLQTTNKRIYAAGDVCSKYKFTHAADAMARIVIRNALFFGWGRASALNIPWCTYTEPELAHVGMYESDAKEQGVETDTLTIQLADVDRAKLDGETEGFARFLLKKGKDKILGATIVAPKAGDMIAEVVLAMNAKKGLGAIADTIHPYPTQAEVIKKAGDAYNRTRLTPLVKKMFNMVLKWQR